MHVAGTEFVGTQGIGQHQCRIAVVHGAGLGRSVLASDEQAEVAFQAAGAHRTIVDEAVEVLAVKVSQFGVVVLQRQLRRPGIVAAEEGKAVRFGGAIEAAVRRGYRHFLVVGGVAQVDTIEPAGMQGQVVDFLGLEVRAPEGLRQQAGRAGKGDRQKRADGTQLQLALRRPGLGSQAQLRIFTGRLAGGGVVRQQAGPGTIRRRVQAHPQQSLGVQAEADRPFGITRPHVENEALRPLASSRLRRGVDVIAIEVIVAHHQIGMAVVDKTGGASLANGQNAGAGAEGPKKIPEHGSVHFYCCRDNAPRHRGAGGRERMSQSAGERLRRTDR